MSGRLRLALKGAVRPHENDSAFLLDRESRAVPGRTRMRRYRQDQPVDMVVVGCGAGGATLAQRLARRGWRVVVLEAGSRWSQSEQHAATTSHQHDQPATSASHQLAASSW